MQRTGDAASKLMAMIQSYQHSSLVRRSRPVACKEPLLDASLPAPCRCINGHLYLVDGCGECVERGACSECGVRIGAGSGDRHARRTAKRVAARLLQEAAFE